MLRNRDEKIFQRVRERALIFQRSLEHNERWKETAKILLQFLLPATKNPHLLQESTLPECLAQSSYWQTFLCLTYMCFLVFKTKSSVYEEKILNSLLLQKKISMLYKPTSMNSVCYQHAIISSGKPQGSLRLSLLFPFFLTCKVISQFPPARNQLYLVLDCK